MHCMYFKLSYGNHYNKSAMAQGLDQKTNYKLGFQITKWKFSGFIFANKKTHNK